jgi:hypothetical protein
MKTLVIFSCALVLLLFLSGCVLVTKNQLENKLPRVDAKKLRVEVSTIYGAAGTLEETGVKWDGDRKTIQSSTLSITSPVGSYKRTIEGAGITNPP